MRPDEEDFVGVVRADFLRARAFVSKRRAEEDFFTQLRVKREARRRFDEERDPAKSEAMEAVPVEDRPLPCASDLLRSYLAQREALGDAADDMLIRRRLATDTGLARCEVLQGLLQSLGEGVHVSGALAEELRVSWTVQDMDSAATVSGAVQDGGEPDLLGTGIADAGQKTEGRTASGEGAESADASVALLSLIHI